MSLRTLIIAFAIVGAILAAQYYYASPNPMSPAEVGLNVGENTATSTPTPKITKATTPSAPKAPAAPVTTSTQFCPKFTASQKLGDNDTGSGINGGVATLQKFLAGTYGLAASFTSGVFDANTENYLKRYQQSVGLAQTGVLDVATQDRMLKPCLSGLMANGVEYPLKSFTISTSTVTESLYLHQGMLEGNKTLKNGAFRLELISAGASAKIRVTGLTNGGLQTQNITLAKGGKVVTSNSPSTLTIELKSLTSSSATLVLSR